MKKAFFVLCIVTVMALSFGASAQADTIIFPYINSNPGNVATIISVINGTDCFDGRDANCAGGTPVGALHYRYVTKLITDAAIDPCVESNFCRPTSRNDVVSFDASGQINSGNALFGDPGAGTTKVAPFAQITYNAGGGNPPHFNDLNPGARRGYLLVTHATNPSSCEDVCLQGELDGDAIIIDIQNAAAWGYRASLNFTSGCGGSAVNNYSFRSSDDILVEGGISFFENTAIFPPSIFQTRYFVTPLFMTSNQCNSNIPNDDMRNQSAACQKRVRFGLVGWIPQLSQLGVYDRNEAFQSGGQYVHVRCVAGIDLASLLGAAFVNPPSTFSSTGGWAVTNLLSPVALNTDEIVDGFGAYDAFVFDLKFGAVTPLIPSPAGAAMVNDGKPIRTRTPFAVPSTAPRIFPDPAGL